MKRRKNASDPVDTGFSFASDWSRGRREFSEPIIGKIKAKSKPTRITFDSELKTANNEHWYFETDISSRSSKLWGLYALMKIL